MTRQNRLKTNVGGSHLCKNTLLSSVPVIQWKLWFDGEQCADFCTVLINQISKKPMNSGKPSLFRFWQNVILHSEFKYSRKLGFIFWTGILKYFYWFYNHSLSFRISSDTGRMVSFQCSKCRAGPHLAQTSHSSASSKADAPMSHWCLCNVHIKRAWHSDGLVTLRKS